MNKAEMISKIGVLMQYWPLEKPAYIDHCSLNFRNSKEGKLLVRVILNRSFPKDNPGLSKMKDAARDAFSYMKKAFEQVTGEKLQAKLVNEEAILNPRNIQNDLDATYVIDVEITVPGE